MHYYWQWFKTFGQTKRHFAYDFFGFLSDWDHNFPCSFMICKFWEDLIIQAHKSVYLTSKQELTW